MPDLALKLGFGARRPLEAVQRLAFFLPAFFLPAFFAFFLAAILSVLF